MKDKLMNINSIEIELLLLNVLTSGMGVIRAYAWITTEKSNLENASPIYVKMNEYMDIQAMGWLLMIASIVLFFSEFMKETAQKYMYIISTFIGSVINMLFGMIGVDNANIFTTYYTSMLVGIVMFIMFMLGVLDLWKTKRSQITD